MLRTRLFLLLFLLTATDAFSQKNGAGKPARLSRPKLVVGIVVDQMRWDYLYRYYDRYGNGGFKRMLNEGFSCENTLINYLPSVTAVGHTCIFTGSVPALDGISGNDWIEQQTGRHLYCTDDSTVVGVGAETAADGKMSPRNLWVSTITDELRIATNYESRTVGISLKDRAAILPAGHTANAAFWLDDASGHFITSTYYMNQLPDWASQFNNEKRIEELLKNEWTTLYPIETYKQSDSDNQPYEGKLSGETASIFPHHAKEAYARSKGSFRSTPFGNELTLEFAEAAIEGYRLGRGPATDFLTINCASTDYAGHLFGPNSIEVEDVYLRLDQDLAKLFAMLDNKIGRGQYLVFLTADHGAANAVGYMQHHKLPADFFVPQTMTRDLNGLLAEKFGLENLVLSTVNYQISFDVKKINEKHLDYDAIRKTAIDYLQQQPAVNYAVDMLKIGATAIPEPLKTMIINGYNSQRSGPIEVIFKPGWLADYARTGTNHGAWNPYDTHIPLLFMGWAIHHGSSNTTVHMTDIAPTIAALLHIQMPNGCIGVPIAALTK